MNWKTRQGDDAPRIFDHLPNVSPPQTLECGDIEAGFAEADLVIENTYSVPVREHAAMEPEAALAYEGEDGKVVIKTPLYHPFVQGTESIANNLAIEQGQVQIICPHMGGNFGTRGDTLHAVVAAIMTPKDQTAGPAGLQPRGIHARVPARRPPSS